MSLRRFFIACAFLVVVVGAAPAGAQYFRNNGIGIQLGWKGLGSTIDGLTGLKIWNMTDQVTVGAGYFTAIGYNLWFDILQADIGIGSERIVSGREPGPIFSFSGTSGVRYQFLEERIRPYIGAHIQYLQIISVTPNPEIPTNALTGTAPFWVGLRGTGGVEYYLADEVSILAHLDLAGFVGLNSPPPNGAQTYVLPQVSGGLHANIYF